jgi:hypothetical protein
VLAPQRIFSTHELPGRVLDVRMYGPWTEPVAPHGGEKEGRRERRTGGGGGRKGGGGREGAGGMCTSPCPATHVPPYPWKGGEGNRQGRGAPCPVLGSPRGSSPSLPCLSPPPSPLPVFPSSLSFPVRCRACMRALPGGGAMAGMDGGKGVRDRGGDLPRKGGPRRERKRGKRAVFFHAFESLPEKGGVSPLCANGSRNPPWGDSKPRPPVVVPGVPPSSARARPVSLLSGRE